MMLTCHCLSYLSPPPKEKLKNLGLGGVDLGLLGNIRHLIGYISELLRHKSPRALHCYLIICPAVEGRLQLPVVSLLLHKLTVHEVTW